MIKFDVYKCDGELICVAEKPVSGLWEVRIGIEGERLKSQYEKEETFPKRESLLKNVIPRSAKWIGNGLINTKGKLVFKDESDAFYWNCEISVSAVHQFEIALGQIFRIGNEHDVEINHVRDARGCYLKGSNWEFGRTNQHKEMMVNALTNIGSGKCTFEQTDLAIILAYLQMQKIVNVADKDDNVVVHSNIINRISSRLNPKQHLWVKSLGLETFSTAIKNCNSDLIVAY